MAQTMWIASFEPSSKLRGRHIYRVATPLCRRDRKLQPQRLHHPDHRAEFRIAFRAQRLVKAFAGQACFFRDPRHPPGPRNGAQRLGDKRRVVRFQRFFHVSLNGLLAVQEIGRIIRGSFCLLFCHGSIFQVSGEHFCRLNVFGLRCLIPAAQQHNDRLAPVDEVNPIARPMVDPKLAYALTGRLTPQSLLWHVGPAVWPSSLRKQGFDELQT